MGGAADTTAAADDGGWGAADTTAAADDGGWGAADTTPAAPAAPAAAAGGEPDYYVADVLYAYDAQEDNEISLVEGEEIWVYEFIDEGWWRGESVNAGEGMFPSNFVQLRE